jgi:uncharacterized protein HemX
MSQGIAILSAAITILALVLSIFGASWLNQRNTEKLLEQMGKRFEARITALEQRFEQRFLAIEQRLAAVEQRLDRIERQLEAVFKPVLTPR